MSFIILQDFTNHSIDLSCLLMKKGHRFVDVVEIVGSKRVFKSAIMVCMFVLFCTSKQS